MLKIIQIAFILYFFFNQKRNFINNEADQCARIQ